MTGLTTYAALRSMLEAEVREIPFVRGKDRHK